MVWGERTQVSQNQHRTNSEDGLIIAKDQILADDKEEESVEKEDKHGEENRELEGFLTQFLFAVD